MPHQTIREDVTVRCSLLLCEFNDRDLCACDCDVEDLDPNREEWCEHYTVRKNLDVGYLFKSVEEIEKYREEDFMEDVPFIAFDPECLRVVYKRINTSKGPYHEAFIQISEKDEKNYEYKPCVDGGVLIVPRDQMDLFSTTVDMNSN
jgi:hypothetical protein